MASSRSSDNVARSSRASGAVSRSLASARRPASVSADAARPLSRTASGIASISARVRSRTEGTSLTVTIPLAKWLTVARKKMVPGSRVYNLGAQKIPALTIGETSGSSSAAGPCRP